MARIAIVGSYGVGLTVELDRVPGAGETVDVPAAAGIFPAEIVNPPREWTARLLTDLRRWTEMPRGGHFAAHEEPGLLAGDVLAFLQTVSG